jgi:tetratricopeptide (TPR) repeat protein
VEREREAMTTQPAARQGKTLVLVLAALLLLGGAVAAYLWWPSGPPAPPEIPLDGVEPKVAQAVKSARAAVVKEPQAAATWGRLGRTLLANELYPDIYLICFNEAERLDPRDPRWPYFAAGALINLGKHEEAIAKLQRAADLCEQGHQAPLAPRLLLAETLLAHGQAAAAEHHFRKALAADKNDPRAHFGLAQLAYGRGDWQACRGYLEQSLGTPQARKKAAALLATVCERLGDKENADKYSDWAARLPRDIGWSDPFKAENYAFSRRKRDQYRAVDQLEGEGRLGEAAAILEQVIESYPDDYLPHLMMARVLPQMREFERVEAHIRRARELAPDKIQADYLMALALFKRGEKLLLAPRGDREKARALFEESVSTARKVLAAKPDYGFAYWAQGLSLKHLGRTDEAIAALRQAVHCNPEYVDIHLALGLTLAEAGQVREARFYLDQAALLAGPNDPRPKAALHKLDARGKADPPPSK